MNEEKLARTIQGEIEKATGEKAVVSIEDSVARLDGLALPDLTGGSLRIKVLWMPGISLLALSRSEEW